MRSPAENLTHRLAKVASGEQRSDVVWASMVMVINALRQEHRTLNGAALELKDLVERALAALKENHYDSNGERRVTNIIVPPLEELIAEQMRIN